MILSSSTTDEEVSALKTEDFVFFRCDGKKASVFYVGIIRKALDEDGNFEVEYLKPSDKVKNKFVNFPSEDIWSVSKKQIIMKLTKSETTGTKRTKSVHIFIDDIVKYAN
ncbi:hypothetical protein PoB_002361900 [Plakobranchus ocellatus]|uniref:Uncharacterized protein n=1 Tax=Plakobranchus ocellatus TaxID=259542 RepID=A0AAV3ZRU4_9GAST|nr:hypothetical protein PoB_002361900 [Plakobranchus ocellatus]